MLEAEVNRLLTDRYGKVCGVERTSADGNIFQEHGPVISATGCFGADFTPDPLLSRHRPACRTCRRPVAIITQAMLEDVRGVAAECVDLEGYRSAQTCLVHPSETDARVRFLAAEALQNRRCSVRHQREPLLQ